jgi:hypothetical protein
MMINRPTVLPTRLKRCGGRASSQRLGLHQVAACSGTMGLQSMGLVSRFIV